MPGIEQAASPAAASRVDEILQAACRVVVSGGASDLRIGSVAEEAGVSRTLVHYYFTTRQELLRAAFAYAENLRIAALKRSSRRSGTARSAPNVHSYGPSTLRSRRIRRCGTKSGRASATTRSSGRSSKSATARRADRIVQLLEEGRHDGSVLREVDPKGAGWRLAAAADGIDSILYLGLLDRDEARVLLASCVIRELER